MYVSEHTGSRVHRQSFNSFPRKDAFFLFFLFFFLSFFLLFLTQFPRRPAHDRTVTRTSVRHLHTSPHPNYLSTVQTDLFDTDRGHNRRSPAILASAIIAPFHERYRPMVKSTRPVSITNDIYAPSHNSDSPPFLPLLSFLHF